jgi:hypothetical protein
MPLKPGDPGYNYETGTTPSDNVVTVQPSREAPVTPYGQATAPAPLPSSYDYEVGGGYYYHPSLGQGTMTGVWGDARGGGTRKHEGQDIRMPMNTPLVAVTSGTITHYRNSSAGTVVYLKGDDGNKYSYFHLNSRVARNGQRVQAGQLIAYSGDSGNSSAPHLHFEVWNKGRKVDPRPFLAQTKTPGQGGAPPPGGGSLRPGDPGYDYERGDTPKTPDVDLFNWEGFQGDLMASFTNMDWSDPNRPYETWIDQLQAIKMQQSFAEAGLAESPRKIKAHNLLRNTLTGMSDMVRRDGYRSKSPGTAEGAQVVTVPPEEGGA